MPLLFAYDKNRFSHDVAHMLESDANKYINYNNQNLAYQIKTMLETLGLNYLWTDKQTNEIDLPIIKQWIYDPNYQA